MMLVPVMVFAIVVLRGWYQGRKRWPARLIEGVIFGMVATALHPVARYVFESRIGFLAMLPTMPRLRLCARSGISALTR